VVWELTDDHPVVDLRLFAKRNFALGTAAISLGYGTFFGSVVLLPLWLQQYRGYTATLAGMSMAPVGLLAIIITPMVGKNLHRVDPRIFSTTAFSIFAVIMLMRSHFNTDAAFSTILIPTLIQGAGVACFFIPLVTVTLAGLRPNQIASASGLSNFARITAGSFGTSIATTMWDHRASFHHAQLTEHINAYNAVAVQSMAGMQSQGLTQEQSFALLNRLIDQQTFTMSANDIFFASALIFLVLIGLVWFTKPVNGTAAGAGAAAGAH